MLSIHLDIDSDEQLLTALAEGLVAANYILMHRAPDMFPPLYESGVRYRREVKGHDDWLLADALLTRGIADCEDLSGYRAAELRRQGEPARVIITRNRSGNFHARVLRADGAIEDPSRILITLEKGAR